MGYVYVLSGEGAPSTCQAGQPLEYTDVPYTRHGAGDVFTLPDRAGLVFDRALSASGGELSGADIY